MRYSFLFLLSLTLTLSAGRLSAQQSAADSIGAVLTLRQAVDIAIRNNLLVNQADIQAQSQRITMHQAWDNMLPNINGQVNQSISYGHALNPFNYTYVSQTTTGNYGISANLVLFQGLQLQNQVRAQSYLYEGLKYDLQAQKDYITLTVLLDYLQVLSSRDVLHVSMEQLTSDTTQLHRLEDLAAAGNLTTANGGMEALPNLRGQVAQDQITIATAMNNLESNKIQLFNLLNVPYKKDVELENSVTTTDLSAYPSASDSIYQTALTVVPTVKSTEIKQLAARRFLAAARGGYFPSLSIGAGINTNYYSLDLKETSVAGVQTGLNTGYYVQGSNASVLYDKTNYNSERVSWGDQFTANKSPNIGLTLNIPILNNLRVRNNVKQQKLNLRTAEINNTNARLVLQQNVEQSFQNMLLAFKQYKNYTDQSADFAESFRIANIKFTEGVVTSDVYIQFKQRADAAAINLAAARYIYIFRTKVLDYYQGRLAIP
ncbi:MAG TPA: TolC family protein [Puia sp.]|nr:TolC family protein [Puia sp.]